MTTRHRRPLLFATALLAVTVTAGVVSGCASTTTDSTSDGTTASTSIDAATNEPSIQTLLADNQDWADDAPEAADAGDRTASITLSGSSASSDDDSVNIDGGTVTITQAGTYTVSGTLDDGQIAVAAGDSDTVVIVLDGAHITSSTTAALAMTAGDGLVVQLADGSDNSLTDATSYAEDAEVNAALYSSADMRIFGSGALTVDGRGNDGITGKDGLLIESGSLTVSAADDAIRGKDWLVVTGGTFALTAGGDGLLSDNDTDIDRGFVYLKDGTVTITAAGDGVQAETDLLVGGGTLDITAGGGAGQTIDENVSTKGLKSGQYIVVEGGTLDIDASDDTLNTNGSAHVAGGTLTLASGDDGVHADQSLLVSGGTTQITESEEGLEAAQVVISGGDTDVVSNDDGVNASDGSGDSQAPGQQQTTSTSDVSLTITGGTLAVDAQGDGLDSNGTIEISGGTTVVSGPTASDNGALDTEGAFTISGGTLLALGSSGMAVSPDADSAQSFVATNLSSSQQAGTVGHVVAEDGTVLASFTATKKFQSVVYSSPEVTSGSSYTVQTGGSADGQKRRRVGCLRQHERRQHRGNGDCRHRTEWHGRRARWPRRRPGWRSEPALRLQSGPSSP